MKRALSAFAVSTVILGGATAAIASSQSGYGKATATGGTSLPVEQFVHARIATAKYATSLAAAKKDGYMILTKQIPGMGYHYINPKVKGFDVRKPPILVYERHGSTWQLGALEWVFTKKPTVAPLKGATYGFFPSACQYADGTFTVVSSAASCAMTSASGAEFTFWHPSLITLHVWLWYHNPAGIYASMNPLVYGFK